MAKQITVHLGRTVQIVRFQESVNFGAHFTDEVQPGETEQQAFERVKAECFRQFAQVEREVLETALGQFGSFPDCRDNVETLDLLNGQQPPTRKSK